jgi:hypothetical protein
MTQQDGDRRPAVQAGGTTDPATGDVPAAQAQVQEALHPQHERYRDPSLKEQYEPEVEPGSIAENRTATYVPDEDKPVDGSEYNPGGPEYAHQKPRGPAGSG